MPSRRCYLRLVPLCALVVLCPALVVAQARADSASGSTHPLPRIAAWASLGLGNSPGRFAGLGSVGAANASVGPFVLAYRVSDFGPYIAAGSGVRDRAFLLGLRSRGRRLFASAAVGPGAATPYHQCDQCGVTTVDPAERITAYDVRLHANYIVPGVALSWSGAFGPAKVQYHGFTVALELGWFGR